jgi:DNA-binding response OmpR family regulator
MMDVEHQVDIVLIEDNEIIAELIHDILSREGYSLHHSNNPEEGIDYAINLNPRLLIIDKGLPMVSGLDVIGYLRDQGIRAKIMLITGDIEYTGKHGEDILLSKPFRVGELIDTIKSLIGKPEGKE